MPTETPTAVPIDTATPAPTNTPTLSAMVEDVSPAVVQIVTPDGASGSGFIIDSNGRVVTNAHVVQGFSSIEVRLVGGQSYTGRVLGVDEVADLAVVQIESRRSFEAVTLGDFDLISIGDDVIAVGFPLGDILRGGSPTITKGIVSAKRVSGSGVQLLQTDAAINPGNSGGPLFGSDGVVVGINTSKLFEASDGRPVEGIGMAVSINEMKDRLDSLTRGQNVVNRTPTPAPVPTPRSQRGPGWFSVDSAELRHSDDDAIETLPALDSVRNFWIHSEFAVPYDASVGDWNVGFLFRNSGGGNLSYVAVTQDGRYSHYVRRDGESTSLDSGDVGSWNQNAGDVNAVSLFVVEDRGWLFVNSEYVTDLDVSGGSREGELEVATGIFTNSEVPGYSTRVSNVRAWELSVLYGPQDGSLTKDSDFISTHRASVDISFAYASAEFRTPDDPDKWSAGLMFRKEEENDYLIFHVSSSGLWRVAHATYSGGDWQDLEGSYSDEIDIKHPTLNRLEILFIGGVAIVYVNGRELGTADISSITTSGDVRVAYGIYKGDDPSTARFEEFTVWGLEGF